VDEGVDTGPIIDQRPVLVTADDDEASLHERIKVVERELLVDVVRRLATHNVRVSGRKVSLA
jgi:phosphoribosylglycinamide formyltransferase-1